VKHILAKTAEIKIAGRLIAALLASLPGACALPQPVLQAASERAFVFGRDSFAFDNQLREIYHTDAQSGRTYPVADNPSADYALHCYVLVRSARQFFQFARFDPRRPRLDDAGYRDLIHAVVAHDPSEAPLPVRILIPGFADLHSFSIAKEALLKAELGSAVQSYLQRGNWRMVFPFSAEHQANTAVSLLDEIRVNRPPLVHLTDFPVHTINHTVLLYGASVSHERLLFKVYDPNTSGHPTTLSYDSATRKFSFAATPYFSGGPLSVYEIYRSMIY
jgi:hypothetical protein